MSEFAKISQSGSIVGACGSFACMERAKVDLSVIYFNRCHPSSNPVSVDTFISSCIVSSLVAVGSVQRLRTWAQIFSAIIQTIVIAMIHAWSIWKQNAMHVNLLPSIESDSVVSIIFSFLRLPMFFIERFVLTGIDKGVLALCQWNYLVGLIKRLDDSVPFHVVFHGLSEKEIMDDSAALVYQGAS
jgi:hypothetical protein